MNFKRDSQFAFLVHPRGLGDFYKKFPYLKFLPKKIVLFLTTVMPPIVVSEITGLKSVDGEPIQGHIISIPITARQMIEDRDLALRKIRQAVLFAEKKGAKIIGLGALTASFSNGGKLLHESVESLGITTGRAYTVKTVSGYAKKAIADFGLPKETIRVGVVGAAGSIGSNVAVQLARFGVKNFVLIDLERKLEKVKKTLERVRGIGGISVESTHDVSHVRECDIIITATSAPEVVVYSDDVSSGTIIINDAQPSDLDPELLRREDVLVIEGGIIHTPGVRCNFNLGLAGKEDTFCCLGEVLILAHNGLTDDFALGELNELLINTIHELEQTITISLADFQNDAGYISKGHIATFTNALEKRKKAWT